MVKFVPTAVGWIDPATTSPSRLIVLVPEGAATVRQGLVHRVEEVEGAAKSSRPDGKTKRGQRAAKTSQRRLRLRRRAVPADSVDVRRWTGGGVRPVDGAGHDRCAGSGALADVFGALSHFERVRQPRRSRPRGRLRVIGALGQRCGPAGSTLDDLQGALQRRRRSTKPDGVDEQGVAQSDVAGLDASSTAHPPRGVIARPPGRPSDRPPGRRPRAWTLRSSDRPMTLPSPDRPPRPGGPQCGSLRPRSGAKIKREGDEAQKEGPRHRAVHMQMESRVKHGPGSGAASATSRPRKCTMGTSGATKMVLPPPSAAPRSAGRPAPARSRKMLPSSRRKRRAVEVSRASPEPTTPPRPVGPIWTR